MSRHFPTTQENNRVTLQQLLTNPAVVKITRVNQVHTHLQDDVGAKTNVLQSHAHVNVTEPALPLLTATGTAPPTQTPASHLGSVNIAGTAPGVTNAAVEQGTARCHQQAHGITNAAVEQGTAPYHQARSNINATQPQFNLYKLHSLLPQETTPQVPHLVKGINFMCSSSAQSSSRPHQVG